MTSKDGIPRLYIFLTFANGGSLLNLAPLGDSHYLKEEEVCSVVRQMLEGVEQLESSKFIHRDFNYNNVCIHFPELEHMEDYKEL